MPSSLVFLDADDSAAPGAELSRAPREGLVFAVEEWHGSVVNAEFEAPWNMRSLETPGAIDVVARVVVTWAAAAASFAFATPDGARESVEALQRHLTRTSEL